MNKLLIGSTLFAAACLCIIVFPPDNCTNLSGSKLYKPEITTINRHPGKIYEFNRPFVRFTSAADTLNRAAPVLWNN